MFNKKFISFTVISGVLASTISQLGFAENGNVDSLETLSNLEDLSVKDETEKVEDLNKNENSDDDSSTDVEDLEDGEDNEDHENTEGTEDKARAVVNLYQRGKEALINKFLDVKPYLQKGKDVLKKVVNHDAFLPTTVALTSAAGAYKLLEKLNNRNTKNEHLTPVQGPEQPQKGGDITPNSTTQQSTSSEEEINKKSDIKNSDSDVTNTSDLPQSDQVVDDKRHLHFALTLAFVFLVFGGPLLYYLKETYVPERNKKYSGLIEDLENMSYELYCTMPPLSTGKLFEKKVEQGDDIYSYLKKVGLIKGNEESVKFAIFPYFKLDLENFYDISSPKVDVFLFNVFIDDKEIGADREETMQFTRRDKFGLRLSGKKLTFNLEDKDDYNAFISLFYLLNLFLEQQSRNSVYNDVRAILFELIQERHILDVKGGGMGMFFELLEKRNKRNIPLDEKDLYSVLENNVLDKKFMKEEKSNKILRILNELKVIKMCEYGILKVLNLEEKDLLNILSERLLGHGNGLRELLEKGRVVLQEQEKLNPQFGAAYNLLNKN